MTSETLTIPSSAYKNLIIDYAYARYMATHLRSPYWQGQEDALMLVFNYCWGLTSVDVQESKEFKQASIDVENAKLAELP
jgi:hypothetical protein